MKKTLRKCTSLLLAGVMMTALAAPALAEEASADGFSWDMCAGDSIKVLFNEHPYSAAIVERMGEFEELTGIKVEYSTIPESNYFDKVAVLLNSGGDDLDIFMTGPYQIWEYAGAGYMQDLDEFINDPAKTSSEWNADDFYSSILNSARWDRTSGHNMGEGGLWGIPMGYEGNVLVYNKRILEEHNIEVPTTTTELLEAAKALKGHSGENTYGVGLRGELGWGSLITAYQSFYQSWGATDFAVEDGKLVSQVNSPEAVAMTDWYVQLIKEGGSPTWGSATWYDLNTDIGNGTAAMVIDASNACFTPTVLGGSPEAENLVVTTLPVVDGTDGQAQKNQLWTWSLAMNSASQHKDAAWLFLQYFTSSEYQTDAFVNIIKSVNAPRASTVEDEGYAAMVDASSGYSEATAAAVDQTGMYYTPETEIFNVLTEWCATVQKLVEGKYDTTQEGMDELKETLDDIVSDIEVE